MGTKLGDLDRYYDPGLTLIVLGREYTVPLASAEVGLWCRRLAPAAARLHQASTAEQAQQAAAEIETLPTPPGLAGLTLPEVLLGDVFGQMVADGVPDVFVQYCGMTALMYVLGGDDLAARWWQSGGRPEPMAPAANRAERRAVRRRGGSSPTTSTAGATTTRLPGSGTGTNSRKNGRRRGSGSTGRTS